MILFFDKVTREVVGVVDGRINSLDQLNSWIGDRKTTDRIVVQWVANQWYNEKGEVVEKDSSSVYTAGYVPDHAQKELFIGFDNGSLNPYDYKVSVDGSLTHI